MTFSLAEPTVARPAHEVLSPRPFAGWALDLSCHLEAACPSTLVSFFSASPLRRQAIFCALAEMSRDHPEELAGRLSTTICTGFLAAHNPLSQIAHSLVAGSPRLVLEAVFGSVPDGFIGALRRIGDDPFPSRATYRSLYDLFVRPEHRCRAKVLGELSGPISETTIKIVRALDPKLLRPEIVTRLWDEQQALELQQAVALAKECAPDLSDEAIAQAIRRIGATTSLSSWLERLLRRATRFPNRPDIPDDHEIRGLHTAEALRDAGRRYSNCAASRLCPVALGTTYLLEWLPSPAIIELAALSGGHWLLDGIWAPKNCKPEPEVVRAIRRKLSDHGVLLPRHQDETAVPQMRVAKLLGVYDFRFGSPELDELEEAVAAA